MKTRTVILTTFGVLTAGMLGIVAFRTEPVSVDIATAERGPMQVTVNVEGKTRIAEIYDVAAPIRGVARRSPVRVGDTVEAGETVVATINPAASDPLDPRSRVQAEAAIREAQAGLQMAKGALDRARAALIEPGDDAIKIEDCCLEIMAPVDGRVLEIETISERPVAAGARLLSIGQPGDLEIVADVLSNDAVRLEVGDRAIVERWGGPGTLEARLSEIEPSAYTKVSALGIEEQRVDVVFDLVSPKEERPSLGHGYALNLRVVEWKNDDVLQIPLSALFRQGEDWAVFVTEGDEARLRLVRIGRTNDFSAEVLDGLSANSEVLVHPSERVEDGTPIVRRSAD